MSTRAKVWFSLVLSAVGLAVVLFALLGVGDVRDHLDGEYQRVSGDGGSAVYRSARTPRDAYLDIRDEAEPADDAIEPEGYFLRYPGYLVVITADGRGSRIYLDDDRRGYGRWATVVAARWGTGGGSGESFRGGGPGSGK